MSVDLGSIFVKLGLQDDLSKGFDDAAKSIQKGSQQMISAGKTLSATVTLPILAMSAALLKVGADFEAASNTIRVGTGATGAALEGLKGNFEDVFSDIPTSAADASQAIADLNTRLGITGEPLENLSKQVLNVSRIMKEDLGGVISSSTRVFGDWGISVEQQGDKLDLLFKTAQATGIGLSELSNRLVSYGAPLRQLGFSFEEAAAMMGKFEKEGVNTELVLGGMKIALGKFAKEGVADPAAALSGLIDKIKEAGSVGDANAIALEVFGQRAGPDMAAAVREGKFDLDELVNSIANSSDTINQAAEDTLSFSEKLTILKNKIMLAVEPLGTSLLNALEKLYPAFEKLTDVLSKVVDFFNSMPDVIQYTTFAFVALAAAIGPVLFVVGTLINSMASLTIAVSGSTIAMGALELVTYSAGVAFGALTISGGAAAIAMTALNTAAYGVGVAFGALEVAAYGAGVAFGTLEVAILGSTAAIAGITIALGAAVIALGAVAYKTLEYQKAAAELKRLDMETSTQRHAEALQKVKNILGDVSNGQQAYNKIMEKGIDNILATKEGHEEIISVLKLLSEEQMALTDRRADEVKVLNEMKEAGAREEEIKAQQKVIDNIDISIQETRNYKTEINNATKAAGENKTAIGGIVSELEDATKAAGEYKAALDGTLPEILPEDVKASHQEFVDSVEATTEESNRIYEEKLKEKEKAFEESNKNIIAGERNVIEQGVSLQDILTKRIMERLEEEAAAEQAADIESLKLEQEKAEKLKEINKQIVEDFIKSEELKIEALEETARKQEEIADRLFENQRQQEELNSGSGSVFGGSAMKPFEFTPVYGGQSQADIFAADRAEKEKLIELQKEEAELKAEQALLLIEEINKTQELRGELSGIVDINDALISSSPWTQLTSELQIYKDGISEAVNSFSGLASLAAGGSGGGEPPPGTTFSGGQSFAPPDYMSPSNSSQVSNNTNNSTNDNSKTEVNISIDGSGSPDGQLPEKSYGVVQKAFSALLKTNGARM